MHIFIIFQSMLLGYYLVTNKIYIIIGQDMYMY